MTARNGLLRHFLTLILPLAALVIVVAAIIGQMQMRAKLDRMTTEDTTRVHLGSAALAASITTPQRHLMSLPRENEIRAAINAATPDKMADVADSLMALLQRNPQYDQARWIDENGRERVRVDKTGEDTLPANVTGAKLQDKSARDYVAITLHLALGKIFISPLDLNIENGKIEIPYKPTIRFAIPVADNDGNRRGIFVINLLGSALLANFDRAADLGDKRILLVNRAGDYLVGPSPADEWGFQLGRKVTIGDQNPRAWAKITEAESGKFIDKDGLWTWETITPRTILAAQGDNPYWIVISHRPAQAVHAAYLAVWLPTLEMAAVLLLIFAVMSWHLAVRSLARQEALTARLKAEVEAAESRRQLIALERAQKTGAILAAVVESSDDAIISKALDGVITSWNPGAEKLFGYPAHEAIGQPMTIVFPPGGEQEEAHLLASIARGAAVSHFETVRKHKDGHLIEVSVSLSPLLDGAGHIVGASKIARDITDANRSKAELDRYREHLEELVAERTLQLAEISALQRAILDSAAYAIIVSDPDGVITLFNPAAEAMLGYKAADFVGQRTRFVLHDRGQIAARAVALSAELGTTIEPGLDVFFAKPRLGLDDACEWTLIRQDGTHVLTWRTITAVKSGDGKIVAYLAIYIDLTQRKLVEREKQRLLDILELSPDFIGSADLAGHVKYLNRAAKDLMGLPVSADVSPLQVTDMHPAWANEIVRETAIPAVLRDNLWHGETAVSNQWGHEIPVSQVIFLHRDSDGAPEMMSTIMRDIGVQQARERELAAAKDFAESAGLAKSQFLTNMSHELRTPLNAILGFSQLLASESLHSTAEQRQDFVYQIVKAGKHLLTLINDILDLAKIDSGKVTLSPEPVALTDMLAECRAMVAPLGDLRAIRLLFPKPDGLHIIADRTRLKQVLLNLLSNAIKYNRPSGTVVVTCELMAAQRIRISVQDSGFGLTPDQLGKLYQPFDRLGQESGGQEGTGIGLVVTKRLVEMMDGAIGVSSTVGIGSNFWIEFAAVGPVPSPFDAEQPQTIAPTAPPASDKPLLLYVEDNPANLKLIEEIIRFRNDLEMISAPDGNLGVQLARAHVPRVILMDLHLPGMNGNEAQQILCNDPRTAHIPIIALTANAMPGEIAKGLAAGFFRYVTKPIDLAELTEAINSALAVAAARDA